MGASSFDVVVVGAGPAGSVAALELARGGARVALVDRVKFPRHKACGDLLSPRSLQTLQELGIALRGARPVGDMRLVGPTGRSTALPWPRWHAFPRHAATIARFEFDDQLREAAASAGAVFVHADVDRVELANGGVSVRATDRRSFRAAFVVGADGSLSRIAESTGLRGPARALWGFALRYYVDAAVDEPLIVYWEPTPGRAFPGYGWVFPTADGRANLGLGISTGADRLGADAVNKGVGEFAKRLRDWNLLDEVALRAVERRGAWLKMGLSGTRPARDRVFLVGDAAGLINPLAGEGISGAILSGRDAAQVILAEPERAADAYIDRLRERHGSFYPITAPLHAFMAQHARLFSVTGRLLTAPGVCDLIGPGWSLYWNDLTDGAPSGRSRAGARLIGSLASGATSASRFRRSIAGNLSTGA